MPERVQRTRRKGQHGMPEGAVYVGRGSKWGNPFRVIKDGIGYHVIHTDEDGHEMYVVGTDDDQASAVSVAVAEYETHLTEHPELVLAARAELAGKDLACWCRPGAPCHGDLLVRVAAGEALQAIETDEEN